MKSHRIHCIKEHHGFEVWLDTDRVPRDGICLAGGRTAREAQTKAVRVLEAALNQIQSGRIQEIEA